METAILIVFPLGAMLVIALLTKKPPRLPVPLFEPLPDGVGHAQPTTIAAAAPGAYVVVTGRVVGEAPLEAPLTGRACVAFDLWVADASREEGGDHTGEGDAVPFELDDGTGRALIDPRGVDVRLDHDHIDGHVRGSTKGRALLARLPAIDGRAVIGYEGALVVGARVVVVGTVAPIADGGDGVYRRSGDPRPHIGAGARGSMVSSRADDDDELRRAEQALAR